MKLTKTIEYGKEEMSGRNQHMWDLEAVNNLEKDFNASAASNYLIFYVAVKQGGICLCARKCQDIKGSTLVIWNRT